MQFTLPASHNKELRCKSSAASVALPIVAPGLGGIVTFNLDNIVTRVYIVRIA